MIPRHVLYKDIDKSKWDKCILSSKNMLIYASSFYLDAMSCKQWNALIVGNYDKVMPLPWRRKYGITYIYQPSFSQQLGIFSASEIGEFDTKSFIAILQKHYHFAEYMFNVGNPITTGNYEIKYRNNYLVSLADEYETITNNFKKSYAKNLNKIQKWKMVYQSTDDLEQVIELYKLLYFNRLKSTTIKDFDAFKSLCILLQNEQNIIARIVKVNEELLSAIILFRYGKRIYNIMGSITESGKKKKSNYFLYDNIIREFSGHDLIFDLVGSDIPGIESFLKNFNPFPAPYPYLRYNHLPAVVKLFKP